MKRRRVENKTAKKCRALHERMTPGFWRVHHVIPAFIALVGLGMALGIAHFSSFQPYKVNAGIGDNIRGWAWADTIGWISLNDQNPSSCGSPPCGTYGLNMQQSTSVQPDGQQGHTVDGFVWSDNLGFICFGSSCNIPACKGALLPNGKPFYAYVEPVSDQTVKKVYGWGVICNQKDSGWISLSCEDAGTCDNPPITPPDRNYRLVFNPMDGKFYSSTFNGNPALSQGVPFGWNGNNNGTGIGYVSFYPNTASPDGMHLVPPAENCNVVGDENLNGLADCSDLACIGLPQCAGEICNGLDDNVNGLVDETFACIKNSTAACATACGTTGSKQCSAVCSWDACVPPVENCTNGVDDDCNGLIDALDPVCVSDQPTCNDGACGGLTGAAQAECCCNDNNTNGPHPLDCLDPMCVAQAPKICSSWSKVTTGNIYAGGGISGTQAPKALNTGNAKYCLRSDGTIEWTSESSCKNENLGSDLTLPTFGTNYRNKLGFLDLDGIRSGRYGTVVTISSSNDIPTNLAGRVYRYVGGGTFTLHAKTFVNGSAPTNKGNGLLLIDGGSLYIDGDVQYSAAAVTDSLKNLASFGVIVVKDGTGNNGNIGIDPLVQTVSGTYFAENLFSTGSKNTNPGTDSNLKIFGILVAKQFQLQRNNNDPSTPAEDIIFDGRAVVNPPPGMQDASQSLPKPDFTY
ncbi:MAG: hypothetical protein PHS79_01320 [Patescibacteria group bacterium]|nr:hypothetical protein [Patescibacteria group bacterium]